MNCANQLKIASLFLFFFLYRYKNILYSQYIEDMKNLKWCTFPDCQYIIEINDPPTANNMVAPIVECACGNRFCFACDMEDHRVKTKKKKPIYKYMLLIFYFFKKKHKSQHPVHW